MRCACCGKPAGEKYSVHRDGFGEGPPHMLRLEVPLCEACGDKDGPSIQEVWRRIADRRALVEECARFVEDAARGYARRGEANQARLEFGFSVAKAMREKVGA